jgi:thymidylate kinase
MTRYEVIAVEGCDGTGKTTLVNALATQHGYAAIYSARAPDGADLAAHYRAILTHPGKLALDRSFVSELVYGTLRQGRSRLSADGAAQLAFGLADRGGLLVHLTCRPDVISARLRARDGYAPAPERIGALLEAYRVVVGALAEAVPVLTIDTTANRRR